MNDDLDARIRRLYAAVGETEEADLTKFPATVISNDKGIFFHQDFSGGKTEEQLANYLHSLIALIAGLEYHLYKWAANNGGDVDKIKASVRASRPFSIVHDLWDSEKHGHSPSRGNDRTGMAPQLLNINRVMKMT